MTENQLTALRMLERATRGYFNIFDIAGKHNATTRQAILTMFTGVEKLLPKAKCGVTALETAFHSLGDFKGDCIAHTERNFIDFAKKACNPRRVITLKTLEEVNKKAKSIGYRCTITKKEVERESIDLNEYFQWLCDNSRDTTNDDFTTKTRNNF